MNPKIQELAERAGGFPLYPEREEGDVSMGFRERALERFAELIVQEMCVVLDKAQWDKGEDWVCADGTRIIEQVREHFGVE